MQDWLTRFHEKRRQEQKKSARKEFMSFAAPLAIIAAGGFIFGADGKPHDTDTQGQAVLQELFMDVADYNSLNPIEQERVLSYMTEGQIEALLLEMVDVSSKFDYDRQEITEIIEDTNLSPEARVRVLERAIEAGGAEEFSLGFLLFGTTSIQGDHNQSHVDRNIAGRFETLQIPQEDFDRIFPMMVEREIGASWFTHFKEFVSEDVLAETISQATERGQHIAVERLKSEAFAGGFSASVAGYSFGDKTLEDLGIDIPEGYQPLRVIPSP